VIGAFAARQMRGCQKTLPPPAELDQLVSDVLQIRGFGNQRGPQFLICHLAKILLVRLAALIEIDPCDQRLRGSLWRMKSWASSQRRSSQASFFGTPWAAASGAARRVRRCEFRRHLECRVTTTPDSKVDCVLIYFDHFTGQIHSTVVNGKTK
jgi:hypothetical protein